MTYVPETIYEIPSAGEHAATLVSETDMGMVPNKFDASKPKHMVKLVFEVDELGSDDQPLRVKAQVTLIRSKKGNLHKYVTALSHPAPVTPDSWELSKYIGRSCGLEIAHNVKPEGTFADVVRIFVLPKTVRLSDSATSFPPTTQPKIVAAPGSSAARASAVRTALDKRASSQTPNTETEAPQVPLE